VFIWVLQEADASMGLDEQEISWGSGQWGSTYKREGRGSLSKQGESTHFHAGLASLKEREKKGKEKPGKKSLSLECSFKDVSDDGESWGQTCPLGKPRIP